MASAVVFVAFRAGSVAPVLRPDGLLDRRWDADGSGYAPTRTFFVLRGGWIWRWSGGLPRAWLRLQLAAVWLS